MASLNDTDRMEVMDALVAASVDATGETLPERLHTLLYKAKEMLPVCDEGIEGPPSDAEARKYIYRSLFDFLAREHGIGQGSSLVYPEEILTAIRTMYPDGVKNYVPKSGKRKRFYQVALEEVVKAYKESEA